jgi:hypothetical protein
MVVHCAPRAARSPDNHVAQHAACMHAATVGACTHARSMHAGAAAAHVERPGEHPLYGDVPSHGVCVTKSVASSHPTTRQGAVINKASAIVGTRACSRNHA